ncbi:hypothetical protein ASPZODRAFT_1831042 [Penicilliopsis zonata CBS 506.65]|uniref:Tr-type G domain-containing protein n=1 Tax=Penicilliopsis zonata CBS 506.65 TaxID=1073090 RepID=A0A1L9SLE0_9EURO|nr:hypothetical protein ASPZODRAFT_1831042 [Penicilliopsis zonata CBS 506.65]OJJ47998.1 hypothetical protein ASPZODRAFT_1831042 [Penicilliopsis zonata CBS 506.65]
MASIFTYDPHPPRVSSPWSTSGSSTPQVSAPSSRGVGMRSASSAHLEHSDFNCLSDYGITKLEPEPQEGPTEYKLHLLLRPRRLYSSMSTGHLVGGSYHSKASLSSSLPMNASYDSNAKPLLPRSSQGRQQRLQQLTTQLLWRLQQSSPFHSSTTSSLVLPMLPEATPQLDVLAKPGRLLPGLEESQGALYEIGVADDGTFVGLTQDELDESLTNLQAMAASLGCKVEVLRRVLVGECEWVETPLIPDQDGASKNVAESLWVAEALVSPDLDLYKTSSMRADTVDDNAAEVNVAVSVEDNHLPTEQIRISIAGASTAGKSSLLGTLTTSLLDNGRGKSRLSLLKHRHEIPSGITSSVAQELIGYAAAGGAATEPTDVINYAFGNIAAWDDIHAASAGGRLAFVSDLPGSTRYVKSTMRGLVSWAPHYVLLCIPANCGEESTADSNTPATEDASDMDLSLSYLALCVKLGVSFLIAITKMDLASRAGLRNTLARILSALKVAGKRPAMLPVASDDKTAGLQAIPSVVAEEVKKVINTANGDWTATVPIVLTSAVDGSGVGKLHALIRWLPIPQALPLRPNSHSDLAAESSSPAPATRLFDVDEVFEIPLSKVYSGSPKQASDENRGVVLCGLVRYGSISIGDELAIGPISSDPLGSSTGPRSRSEHLSGTALPSTSLRSRPSSGELAGSSLLPGKWQPVRVVSVRNLRLPVQKLVEDQVGTIGVEPICSPRLGKIRKGMVLADFRHCDSSSVPANPAVYHVGFVATFAPSEFASAVSSPPLLLGGNAIVYIANIRAVVKVTCVTLSENEIHSSSLPPSPREPEFFSFDNDPDVSRTIPSPDVSHDQIKLTCTFVTSVEWVQVESPVILMPGASMACSTTGTPGALSGLQGFVGRVCDVLSEGDS